MMESLEEAFRDGLREAVSGQPAIAPIELDEVLARAARPAVGRRPIGRWVGLAAAMTIAAGLGLWAVQASSRVPTEPQISRTPTAARQVRTLRVHNDTSAGYRQAALQLPDGHTLAIGDVPAGGTVLVPMDDTFTANPSLQVVTGGVDPGLKVLYSGDCTVASGQLVAVFTDAAGVTVQVVGASDSGPAASAGPIDPASVCTITITDDQPTPEPTHS